MNQFEIWKDIIGYIGIYAISNWGRIKSYYNKRGIREKILKQYKDRGGYLHVTLYKNGKRKCCVVNRIVLETFIGICPQDMETCHNDGDPTNNNLNNLRYDTKSNNQKDRIIHGTNYYNLTTQNTRGIKNSHAKLNEKQVRIIKYLLKTKILMQNEIAAIFNVDSRTISAIKNNKIWIYIENYK